MNGTGGSNKKVYKRLYIKKFKKIYTYMCVYGQEHTHFHMWGMYTRMLNNGVNF